MGTISVNGTTLHHEEAGAGPAVLFVHGMAGFAGVWADQMERLRDAFHVVAYDRRLSTAIVRPSYGRQESCAGASEPKASNELNTPRRRTIAVPHS